MPTLVSQTAAAPSAEALAHFEARMRFETDCWDVHAAIESGAPDFVLADVRAAEGFAKRHVPGAIHIPHGEMTAERMAEWPADTLFVVYCAGPHCNGANKAAINLARLGRPVKEMIGGMTGWADEKLAFER